MSIDQAKKLLTTTNRLWDARDRGFADTIWEIVAGVNDGFNDGFNNGIDDKGIKIFIKMIKEGFSREDAQAITEVSDELVMKALEMC